MKTDKAIEEIRAVRRRISEQFGHDTKAVLDHYRQLEAKYKDRILREPARSSSYGPKSRDPKKDT